MCKDAPGTLHRRVDRAMHDMPERRELIETKQRKRKSITCVKLNRVRKPAGGAMVVSAEPGEREWCGQSKFAQTDQAPVRSWQDRGIRLVTSIC